MAAYVIAFAAAEMYISKHEIHHCRFFPAVSTGEDYEGSTQKH